MSLSYHKTESRSPAEELSKERINTFKQEIITHLFNWSVENRDKINTRRFELETGGNSDLLLLTDHELNEAGLKEELKKRLTIYAESRFDEIWAYISMNLLSDYVAGLELEDIKMSFELVYSKWDKGIKELQLNEKKGKTTFHEEYKIKGIFAYHELIIDRMYEWSMENLDKINTAKFRQITGETLDIENVSPELLKEYVTERFREIYKTLPRIGLLEYIDEVLETGEDKRHAFFLIYTKGQNGIDRLWEFRDENRTTFQTDMDLSGLVPSIKIPPWKGMRDILDSEKETEKKKKSEIKQEGTKLKMIRGTIWNKIIEGEWEWMTFKNWFSIIGFQFDNRVEAEEHYLNKYNINEMQQGITEIREREINASGNIELFGRVNSDKLFFEFESEEMTFTMDGQEYKLVKSAGEIIIYIDGASMGPAIRFGGEMNFPVSGNPMFKIKVDNNGGITIESISGGQMELTSEIGINIEENEITNINIITNNLVILETTDSNTAYFEIRAKDIELPNEGIGNISFKIEKNYGDKTIDINDIISGNLLYEDFENIDEIYDINASFVIPINTGQNNLTLKIENGKRIVKEPNEKERVVSIEGIFYLEYFGITISNLNINLQSETINKDTEQETSTTTVNLNNNAVYIQVGEILSLNDLLTTSGMMTRLLTDETLNIRINFGLLAKANIPDDAKYLFLEIHKLVPHGLTLNGEKDEGQLILDVINKERPYKDLLELETVKKNELDDKVQNAINITLAKFVKAQSRAIKEENIQELGGGMGFVGTNFQLFSSRRDIYENGILEFGGGVLVGRTKINVTPLIGIDVNIFAETYSASPYIYTDWNIPLSDRIDFEGELNLLYNVFGLENIRYVPETKKTDGGIQLPQYLVIADPYIGLGENEPNLLTDIPLRITGLGNNYYNYTIEDVKPYLPSGYGNLRLNWNFNENHSIEGILNIYPRYDIKNKQKWWEYLMLRPSISYQSPYVSARWDMYSPKQHELSIEGRLQNDNRRFGFGIDVERDIGRANRIEFYGDAAFRTDTGMPLSIGLGIERSARVKIGTWQGNLNLGIGPFTVGTSLTQRTKPEYYIKWDVLETGRLLGF